MSMCCSLESILSAPNTAQSITAHNVDLIVNDMHTVNPLENAFQELPKVKGRNAAAHRKYAVTVFKLESVSATAKMDVSVQLLSDTMCGVDPRCEWLSFLLFR
jgi:hypothetical protein